MKSISGKKLCKVIEKFGWTLVRIRGSHHIYTKEGILNIYNNMLGNFQKSQLRIEVKATAKIIGESLLYTKKLRQWFWFAKFKSSLPSKLESGLTFSTWFLGIEIRNQVEIVNDHCLRLLLSKGIDGYQEWFWGDGWVQSSIYGISLLPLNFAQTLNLLSLRNLVEKQSNSKS